jgi:hypothetical protein
VLHRPLCPIYISASVICVYNPGSYPASIIYGMPACAKQATSFGGPPPRGCCVPQPPRAEYRVIMFTENVISMSPPTASAERHGQTASANHHTQENRTKATDPHARGRSCIPEAHQTTSPTAPTAQDTTFTPVTARFSYASTQSDSANTARVRTLYSREITPIRTP